ncbi:MAG TPA: dihydrofolate reductase family protein [Chryseolinea sp.]|nr:dihydrofolate reductase family protein [Chryseolinea sp.]
MSKVFFAITISLDGYMAGDNRSPQNPIGDDGTTLHKWLVPQKAFLQMEGKEGGLDGPDNKLLEEILNRAGAYIMGKRMFDEGEPNWPEDLFKADVCVLTHQAREPWRQKGSTTYYFINEGIESVLEKAKKSAKGMDVQIQGGANTIQQFLNAGLVDEFYIHIAPIILGSGIRLLDNINKNIFTVEISEVIPSGFATHTKYKLTKK